LVKGLFEDVASKKPSADRGRGDLGWVDARNVPIRLELRRRGRGERLARCDT
jgi:hypothetical protein